MADYYSVFHQDGWQGKNPRYRNKQFGFAMDFNFWTECEKYQKNPCIFTPAISRPYVRNHVIRLYWILRFVEREAGDCPAQWGPGS